MELLTGPVPEGWSHSRLAEICDIQAGPSGTSVRLAERVADGVPIVVGRNLCDGVIVGADGREVSHDVAERLGRYRLRNGDVLCTRTGELGRHGLATVEHDGWLFAPGLLRLSPRSALRPGYLNRYLALPAVRDWITRNATGTVIPVISPQVFGQLPVTLPQLHEQEAIDGALETLDRKARVHAEISRNSERLRDVLAQVLIAGGSHPWPSDLSGA